MVNIEHKLTVDDLIVEYMIYKVKNGYAPRFTTAEFISFLYYFEQKYPVEDAIYKNEELFKRFFKRKAESDWYTFEDDCYNKKLPNPHMDIEYSQEEEDYIIKANYKLSDYDISVINTYFMDRGLSKFDDYDGTAKKIRNIIAEYLSDKPKRNLDNDCELDEGDIMCGKYIAAEIVTQIWDSQINAQIKYNKWPEQCRDINKFLFDNDLAKIIGVPSMKEELIEIYRVLSIRIALLYREDRNLKVSSSHRSYLARANYDFLIQGYERQMNAVFGPYKKTLDFDLSNLTFSETHVIDSAPVYYLDDDDPEYKKTTTKIGNEKVKKLVGLIEEEINKN